MATVALGCSVIGNEARAGEYFSGGFLCGVDPLRVTAGVETVVFTSFAASISGAGVVAADLSVRSPIQFAASIQGVGAAQASLSRGVPFSSSLSGVGQITVQASKTTGLAVVVSGVGTVSPTMIVLLLVKLDASISGAASVQTPTLGLIKDLAIHIGEAPLCGEHLCGTFVCDAGCATFVVVQDRIFRGTGILIQGQGSLQVNLNQGHALAAVIAGVGRLAVKFNLDWLVPTDPIDWILLPTDEEDDPWILIPTTDGSAVLVPATGAVEVLEPTDEADWILIPTTERTM